MNELRYHIEIMIVENYPFPSHLSFDVKYMYILLRSFIKNKKNKRICLFKEKRNKLFQKGKFASH